MDTDTGKIYTPEDQEKMKKLGDDISKLFPDFETASDMQRLIPMEKPPTEEQMKRNPPKVGRNEMCPCGSGKKFKNCHWTGRY